MRFIQMRAPTFLGVALSAMLVLVLDMFGGPLLAFDVIQENCTRTLLLDVWTSSEHQCYHTCSARDRCVDVEISSHASSGQRGMTCRLLSGCFFRARVNETTSTGFNIIRQDVQSSGEHEEAKLEKAAASFGCPSSSHFPTVDCRPGNPTSIVFHHNAESRTLVNGFEPRGSYKKQVEYTHDMAVIASVMSCSLRCEQFWKYESKRSRLTDAFWVSRNGLQVEKFPSGTVDNPCYCSGTETCCCYRGCNANTATTWGADEGFLTNMGLLPVKELRFGDTGNSWEKGYHTLGPLVCYI